MKKNKNCSIFYEKISRVKNKEKIIISEYKFEKKRYKIMFYALTLIFGMFLIIGFTKTLKGQEEIMPWIMAVLSGFSACLVYMFLGNKKK